MINNQDPNQLSMNSIHPALVSSHPPVSHLSHLERGVVPSVTQRQDQQTEIERGRGDLNKKIFLQPNSKVPLDSQSTSSQFKLIQNLDQPSSYLLDSAVQRGLLNQSEGKDKDSESVSFSKTMNQRQLGEQLVSQDPHPNTQFNHEFQSDLDQNYNQIPQFTIGAGTSFNLNKSDPQQTNQASFSNLKGQNNENKHHLNEKNANQSTHVDNKPQILTKNSAFDSQTGLSTGRFQVADLNHSAGNSQIKSQEHEVGGTFTILGGGSSSNIENEMRETSYFKQNHEEEPEQPDQLENQENLIQITDQNTDSPQKGLKSEKSSENLNNNQKYSQSQRNPENRKLQKISINQFTSQQKKRLAAGVASAAQSHPDQDIPNSLPPEKNLTKPKVLATQEGIQLFKIQSKSQMKQRSLNPVGQMQAQNLIKMGSMPTSSQNDQSYRPISSQMEEETDLIHSKLIPHEQRSEYARFENSTITSHQVAPNQLSKPGGGDLKYTFGSVNKLVPIDSQTPTNLPQNGRTRALNLIAGVQPINLSMNDMHHQQLLKPDSQIFENSLTKGSQINKILHQTAEDSQDREKSRFSKEIRGNGTKSTASEYDGDEIRVLKVVQNRSDSQKPIRRGKIE